MPVFKVCSLLRMSPAGGHHHSLEISSSLPWQWLLSCTVPSAQRAGEMLHPKLRSMSLYGKVGRVLCSSGVLPAPSFSSPCASCTFFFFFFQYQKKNTPFFLGMGDLKREIICLCSVFISQSLYIYIYDTHIYIFILFFSFAWSFIQTTCVTVLSLITSVLLTPVLLSCKIIALLFQSSHFYCKVQTWLSGDNTSHLGILHT